jgi:glucose 1-dehydrogenase
MAYTDREAAEVQLSLRGRNVLITGASLGIGRDIARLFAWHGARLALHHAGAADAAAGHADATATLVREITQTGAHAVALNIDLLEHDSGRKLADMAADAVGEIDIVVLSASVQTRERFDQIDVNAMRRMSRVNLEASIEILQSVTQGMCARNWGRVIAIGSVNQVRPEAQLVTYAALKAAHHNLIVNAARAHAASGVTFNTISPGLIATPRNAWRRADAQAWAQIEHDANPMRRAGQPEEIAPLALLLASDAGAFITGADIPVDGGARL